MIIYAADDEILALEFLSRAITKCAPEAELKTFTKPKDLLKETQQKPCDIAFLDIEMPGIKGIDLAKVLKEYNSRVNIIFTTGYSEYMSDALNMFASGYILKPVTLDAVTEQMKNLRYPIDSKKRIYAITFGIFTLMCDGTPAKFRLNKSRELLAYLIDRNGSYVQRREAFSVLYEDSPYDRKMQKNFSKIVRSLEEDLQAVKASELLSKDKEGLNINKNALDCDLYDFLNGNKSLYNGEYMEQYSWGEGFKARYYE